MIYQETEEELLTLSPEDMLNITQVSKDKKGTKLWLFPKSGGFPQQTHGFFPTKNDQHLGCEMGKTHHLRKHPYRDHGCFFWYYGGL